MLILLSKPYVVLMPQPIPRLNLARPSVEPFVMQPDVFQSSPFRWFAREQLGHQALCAAGNVERQVGFLLFTRPMVLGLGDAHEVSPPAAGAGARSRGKGCLAPKEGHGACEKREKDDAQSPRVGLSAVVVFARDELGGSVLF